MYMVCLRVCVGPVIALLTPRSRNLSSLGSPSSHSPSGRHLARFEGPICNLDVSISFQWLTVADSASYYEQILPLEARPVCSG
ncbi:hypothetical protein BV25DRAFT_486078 [Artomyces pyxidatus]|uniref:Uncharacterized protein n=1 Tax=Artomyces pyxidatus TaxID=48021 RepID=A0ACB8T4A2_9AGAM|nr:hypothetical protein BV25DRAFT_486078 [Artomyces pyxidatus]